MRERGKILRAAVILAAILPGLCQAAAASSGAPVAKSALTLTLGETGVRVNVYERPGAAVTFVAPHHNEQSALGAAREAVALRGGRLIEIVSLDEGGNPARRLRFLSRGKSYSVDPNRIFTENGRRCGGVAPEIDHAVRSFAGQLLGLIFAPGGGLRDGEHFIVAVHNNGDVDGRGPAGRAGDLTAAAFARAGGVSRGAFHDQAAGVYLSNLEEDEDNFVLVSSPRLMGYFADKGFSVVVQKPAAALEDRRCAVDDGSLSVYAARQQIPYVCLEADAASGAPRQRQMLEAVYELLPRLAAESLSHAPGAN